MPLRQQFSTTIYSWDGEMSAEVMFLPRGDMAVPESDPEYSRFVVDTLGPESLPTPVRFHNLEADLATFLANAENRDFWELLKVGGPKRQPTIPLDALDRQPLSVRVGPEYVDFAKELLSSSRIPIEESPLSGVPLGELFSMANKASPTGLGALIGWIIAGNTPLLLLWVPVGIILVRGAVGIGKGLEEGLQAQVKKLFTPHRARKG